MTESRLPDYLDHMRQAAMDACVYVDGLTKSDFIADKRTQQAVIMNLVIIGEAATKIIDRHGAFAAANPSIPWQSMRGMRNRIAHGYFDLDLDVVWDTVRTALPKLVYDLAEARTGDGNDDRS